MSQPFSQSYIGKLRAKIGNDLLMVPGVRVVLENASGEIAFIRRTDNGLWALPAGAPEINESIEDAARREVFEETGLTLKSFSCFGFASDPQREIHTYPNGHVTHSFAVLLYSTDFEGSVGDFDDEVSEVRFFPMSNLPLASESCASEYHSVLCYRVFKETGLFQWS